MKKGKEQTQSLPEAWPNNMRFVPQDSTPVLMDFTSPQDIKDLSKVLLQAKTLGCWGEYTAFIVNIPLSCNSSYASRNGKQLLRAR